MSEAMVAHAAAPTPQTPDAYPEHHYADFVGTLNYTLKQTLDDDPDARIFRTDAKGLYDIYLANLPCDDATRKHYDCMTCRDFMRRYGRLVTINPDGTLRSVLFDPENTNIPAFFKQAVAALQQHTQAAVVTGLFVSDLNILGVAQTGEWSHFSLRTPPIAVFKSPVKKPHQFMADMLVSYGVVRQSLADYDATLASQALTLIRTGNIPNSNIVFNTAVWFDQLHRALDGVVHNLHRNNIIWRATAMLPPGVSHVRNGMLGTILEDLKKGRSVESIIAGYRDKTEMKADGTGGHMRPQAAPADATIEQAEILIATLGIGPSLERRWACFDEIPTWWQSKTDVVTPASVKPSGMFDHLRKPETVKPATINAPRQTMSWDKFQRTILPMADALEVYANPVGNYSGYATAVHADAPPLLKWDNLTQRHPLSSFTYPQGSPAGAWGLKPMHFYPVAAIAHNVEYMYNPTHPDNKGVVLLVREMRHHVDTVPLCIFPDSVIHELYPIRAVIEAHSNSQQLAGYAAHDFGGVTLTGGQNATILRVTTGGVVGEYYIDRWD